MVLTLALAALLLYVGKLVKNVVPILQRFFIPVPVVGGLLFSLVALFGHETGLFSFTLDDHLRPLLMMAFFTTVGFTASYRMLVAGGIGVAILLGLISVLITLQNTLGVTVATVFGENPLLGLATGSISLVGGHGTSAAFGPELERLGMTGALSVSVAAATFGLVAGSLIGGSVGKRLIARFDLKYPVQSDPNEQMQIGSEREEDRKVNLQQMMTGCMLIAISMGLGSFIVRGLNACGLILPAYIGPMIVAAVIRNIGDVSGHHVPVNTTNILGMLALQYFLAMALMSMRLWELASLAVPLVTALVLQTVLMALFAYFVVFRVMGRDYDAAVIAVGSCGFGLGATPNAMANMEAFTAVNGPSPKAFFVVPLVGALFNDFVNASLITLFMMLLT